MADLTVLHGTNSLYPITHGLFSKSTPRFTVYHPSSTPSSAPLPDRNYDADETVQDEIEQRKPRGRSRPKYDNAFLSPPINTWKSPNTQRRHRHTRSHSAPPGPERRPKLEAVPEIASEDIISPLGAFTLRSNRPIYPKRSFSSFASIGTTRGGELLPPPPPLLRPTTFWRKTRRSGVTGASYSPSSHLIRRSTYIAAGLQFDAPIHDLSALCVESRVGCIVIPPEFSFTPN